MGANGEAQQQGLDNERPQNEGPSWDAQESSKSAERSRDMQCTFRISAVAFLASAVDNTTTCVTLPPFGAATRRPAIEGPHRKRTLPFANAS